MKQFIKYSFMLTFKYIELGKALSLPFPFYTF